VLVPGFAGFDALGQLEYYAGITPLFQKQPFRNEVLHYFDNLPTAAVVTRAARLRGYLAKRIARGEIARGDDVILVGHSTGGLDIRWRSGTSTTGEGRRSSWTAEPRSRPPGSSLTCGVSYSSQCPIGEPTLPTGCIHTHDVAKQC